MTHSGVKSYKGNKSHSVPTRQRGEARVERMGPSLLCRGTAASEPREERKGPQASPGPSSSYLPPASHCPSRLLPGAPPSMISSGLFWECQDCAQPGGIHSCCLPCTLGYHHFLSLSRLPQPFGKHLQVGDIVLLPLPLPHFHLPHPPSRGLCPKLCLNTAN